MPRPKTRVIVNAADFKEAENMLRDLINWVAVFETEHKVAKEVVQQLKDRISQVAEKLGLGTIA